MSDLRWALVHAVGDPAASAWTAAAASVSSPPPRLVSWDEVLEGTAAFGDGELVHAERLVPRVPGLYGGSRARYERLGAALAVLGDRLAAEKATATADTTATLRALDRKRCAEHLAAAGIPVPETGTGYIRQRFAEPCDAISYDQGNALSTTLGLVRTRTGYELHHTLRGAYYGAEMNEMQIVSGLLTGGDETVGVEDLPTAYLEGAHYRFRFAVIDGRVTHAVGLNADKVSAREYYGGRRREIDAYHGRFGEEAWLRLIGLAERAAAAFPELSAVGVDIAASQVNGPDLVYDIDPFGARMPAALGIPGTAGECLEVQATMLRSWTAMR